MKNLYFASIFLGVVNGMFAQNLPSFKAPEPSKVFEFTKYDQIPIGEYTGIPNISLPLHSIQIDEVSIPIGLQYHAGGFRVSEEASNVGLGWNMNFGMITQTINDKDDLQPSQFTKKLLKYQDSPTTGEWTIKCTALVGQNNAWCEGYGYTMCSPEPTFPIGTPKVTNSIFIATGGAYPVENQSYCITSTLDRMNWDTEPDIFRVSFFGHSLKFIKKFVGVEQGQIEILDNKGYKIEMIQNNDNTNQYYNGSVNWKITTPNGDQYIFSKQRQDVSQSNTWGNPLSITPDTNAGSTSGGSSYNNSWSLIQIITNKNKVIDFEYSDFGITPSRSYSQTFMKATDISSYTTYTSPIPMVKGFYGPPPGNQSGTNEFLVTSVNASYEKSLYVTKITSPNEVLTFQYSGRDDRGNDKKLDIIEIKNKKNVLIKQFNFGYDYFVANQNGGEIVPPQNGTYTTDMLRRLKLVSVQQMGQNPHIFEYNATQLPKKNSNAVDFWGFYNGKTNNVSMVPNPAALGSPEMGNNGNDKSAYEGFAKACVLEKIIYPTGGKTVYEYELNEYDRLSFEPVVTNAGGAIGNVIKGNGIRVKSISLFDREVLQRKTNYAYSGGKCLTPFEIRNRFASMTSRTTGGGGFQFSNFAMNEFYSSNFLRPTLMGSFNAVGYDQVTSEHISAESNGKTVWKFMNVRDDKPHYDASNTYNKLQLPSLMKINTTENGKVLSEEIYGNGNSLLMKKEYNYLTKQSNIYYGNSISPFRSYIGYDIPQPQQIIPRVNVQELVGYYAIYGKQSLLSSEKVTEYFPSGSKWVNTTYSYNANNLVTNSETRDQSSNLINKESTTFYSTSALTAKNWLSLPQQKITTQNAQTNYANYAYQILGNFTLPLTIEILPGGSSLPEYKKKIFYDQYDDMGNIIEFHIENGLKTCVIWGYNKTLPIAKIDNVNYAQVASYVTNLQNLSNTGTEANLIIAQDNLRNAFPGAMVTTYTHNLGIGISTITDIKGNTVYYKYDTANRLMLIKDEKEKLLSEYEYHFRPQN